MDDEGGFLKKTSLYWRSSILNFVKAGPRDPASGWLLHHLQAGPRPCSAHGDLIKGDPMLPGTLLFPKISCRRIVRGGGHFGIFEGTAPRSTAPGTRPVDRRAPRSRVSGEWTGFTAVYGGLLWVGLQEVDPKKISLMEKKNRQQTRGTGSPIGGSMKRSPPIAVSIIT